MSDPHKPVGAIFDAAIELPPERRAACVQEACAGNDALRQRVEALLRAHDSAETFMASPAVASRGGTVVVKPAEKPGDRIGRYKLLQQIGEGGCGVVYMAEQEEPVRRMVALKVIKLGMDTKQVIARFEAERQALALMDHPNIAGILDVGATDTGRPFFVMELVRGIKITDYCDKSNLPTRERLDLFVQVCQAVQHAHQKGIIHRDIKPSNILVTLRDGVPVPKVIDFGIAKATQQRLTDKTLFTAFEQFIGTPAYMSPEQAEMSELGIDTRSDIYSLGVLLYELLTGTTPFDSKALLQAGLDEIRRTIREKEPIRPSTRLTQELVAADARRLKSSASGEPATGEEIRASSRRLLRIKEIIPLLRGDLDWIVMKALEKDRARRYETANGLARDIQRFLADEPVAARPPSKLYRLQKLARRNKLAFAAAGAVATALILGLAASTWEYLKERKARQQAVAAHEQAVAAEKEATKIAQFLTDDLLFQATPEGNSREKQITLEQALAAATRRLDQNAEIRQQPKVEATLRLAIGRTYHQLWLSTEADRNLRRAFELRHRELGPTNSLTLDAEFWLGTFLEDLAHEYEGAGTLLREVWQGRQQLLGPEHADTLQALQGYQITLYQTAHFKEAEQIARYLLPIRERTRGPDDAATIDALLNLEGCVGQQGDHAQAEALCRELLRRCDPNGSNKSARFVAVKDLASHRIIQGDPAEADRLMSGEIPHAAREFGPTNLLTLHLQRVLARAFADEGCFVEAEVLARATLEDRLRQNSDLEGNGRTMLILGRALAQQGKLDQAEALLQAALRLLREHIHTKDAGAVVAANWLGAIQVSRKAYREAENLMLPDSDQLFSPAAQLSPTEIRLAAGNIIALYEAWGKPQQAGIWQKKLDQLAKSLPAQQP